MPNIITHGLFAKKVYDHLTNKQLQTIIKKYPREFIIGSNGPDFFFFYKFFQKEYEHVRNIGNLVHASKINDFFSNAFKCIENEQDLDIKEAMISYISGHLCHWALDSRSHPYVNYKTGAYSGISESWHHRFESMMDAMMLKRMKNETIHTFKFYLLAKQSNVSVKAISKVYIPTLKEVYHIDLSEKQIQDALNDWYHIQTYLYDPTGIKTKILKLYEKRINKPWLYSGSVVPSKIDETYDVLNLKHQEWCYPTDNTKTSNESFIEIFDRAQDLAIECLDSINDLTFLLAKLNNESYDTGESIEKELKYFDYIYGGEHENI